jgi:hypothetical protein
VSDTTLWPWVALFLLGAVHGVNPGMGWLFAVALGLQEQRARAVWRALLPLALGHAAAVGAVVAVAAVVGLVTPPSWLKWIVAALLLTLGVLHLVRHRHPRYGGMQVSSWNLAVWSFLMATAHGAGRMALPLVLGLQSPAHHAGHAGHVMLAGFDPTRSAGIMATGIHTTGYLLVLGVVAAVVYRKLGLRMLRTMWFNIDLVWAGALIVTAVLTPVL